MLHDELTAALHGVRAPDPAAGERIRLDRGSELEHLGVRTPVRRALVADGFSFTRGSASQLLIDWDLLWQASPCADVLFMVLDHYRESLRNAVPDAFWPVARTWIGRVDNWAHADDLARVYSWALEAQPDEVYPQLVRWNASTDVWHRRISLVSVIHYAGANAFFLPLDMVLPLIEASLDDHRPSVQKAIGWVLRAASDAHPVEVASFLEAHLKAVPMATLRRATEHWEPDDRAAIIKRRRSN